MTHGIPCPSVQKEIYQEKDDGPQSEYNETDRRREINLTVKNFQAIESSQSLFSFFFLEKYEGTDKESRKEIAARAVETRNRF